ncbi:hypothetical protein [Rhizobium mongolense]|uniref:Uncharacterized protein n=2 Tax=Rhizobium mongolense TaxID=57676 RepID=A0ABR6IRA7_9HYPH|nr:hypothetical protein [Rhizobium mongolense]MBB4230044.1 hypothetical protein [Rhizobium mongolense]TVZ72824.1 hypothetical protein BCL32_1011 [Rhizobium mongolense USDA 1844]
MRKMSKKPKTFETPTGEFFIPSQMLPPPQDGFISVADLVAKIAPANRAIIADAYRRHLRSKGGAA